MSNGEDDLNDLLDEWEQFTKDDDDEDEQPETDDGEDQDGVEVAEDMDPEDFDPEEMGLDEDVAEVLEEQFEMMQPDDPELLDLTLDDAVAEVTEDDDEEDGEEEDEDDDDDDEEDCEGTKAFMLTPLEEVGRVRVMLNFQTADAIRDATVVSDEPTEDQLESLHPQLADEIEVNTDLNSDEFRGSYSGGVEIHVDDEDFETVHEAIAKVMTPTESKLYENPDAEITADNLYPFKPDQTPPSCHENYDNVRTYTISREGDSETFANRGPWVNRRFNIQDLIDELQNRTYKSTDGVMVVVHATPFK